MGRKQELAQQSFDQIRRTLFPKGLNPKERKGFYACEDLAMLDKIEKQILVTIETVPQNALEETKR